MESVLNVQFGRLWQKENEVVAKIRASKHSARCLTSYLRKKAEIESKYVKELNALSDDYKDKMHESDILRNAWNEMLQNDKLQNERRQKYIQQIQEQHQVFNQLYAEEKKSENQMSKQIENNKKMLQISQKKMDKVW